MFISKNPLNFSFDVPAFHEMGFMVLRAAISAAEVQELVTLAEDSYQNEPWLDPHAPVPPNADLEATNDQRELRQKTLFGHMRPLLMAAPIATALSVLMADDPVVLSDIAPFRTSPSRRERRPGEIWRDPQRNAHVHHYSHIEPSRGSVMGWFALEDIKPDAGPMWIEPGSHRRNTDLFDVVLASKPFLQVELDELRKRGASYATWWKWMYAMQEVMTDILESRIDAGGGERIPVLLQAGDVLLFDSALTHGTIVPADRDATRWSSLARYQGRNAAEYGWPTWFGNSKYAPAIEKIQPARIEVTPCGAGYAEADFNSGHMSMFWSSPIA